MMPAYGVEDFHAFCNYFQADSFPDPFVHENPTDGNYYFGDVSATESSPESNALTLPPGTADWNTGVNLDLPLNFGPLFEPTSIPQSSRNGTQQGAMNEVGAGMMEPDFLLQSTNNVSAGVHNHVAQCDSSHTEAGDNDADTDSTLESTRTPDVPKTSQVRISRPNHHRPAQSTPIVVKLPGRRAPFKDLREREQTGVTRRLGACLRCRMQKTRVRFLP